jgi:hypothetical protein
MECYCPSITQQIHQLATTHARSRGLCVSDIILASFDAESAGRAPRVSVPFRCLERILRNSKLETVT